MTDQLEKCYMALFPQGKIPDFFHTHRNLRFEVLALAVVLLVSVLSWQMINAVATSLYRQYETLGDPPLFPITAAGPELGQSRSPARLPSQLGHLGYFWSERAFHYRLALMFAVDEYQDPEILSRDTWQQHPDGVNAWREYAVMMEPVYGFFYRLAGDQARPLVEFLLRLIPLVHVLLFFPLYALARAVGCRRFLAAFAVVFYATCTLGFARMTGSLLLKEDFALLLFTVFLALHYQGWRRQNVKLLVLAAVVLIPLLACWHLSQFLVLVIMLSVAVAWAISATDEKPATDRIPFSVLMPLVYTLAGLAAGLTPSLWARGFFISLPMGVLYAWLTTAAVVWKKTSLGRTVWVRALVLSGLIIAAAALAFFNRSYTGDYGHVFGLFLQKLAHGFQRPADPGLLPFDTRVFWASPFNTPTRGEIWSKLGFHAVILAPVLAGCLVALFHRRTDRLRRSFLLMVPAFLAAYLMIERLGVVFLVFAAVAVAMTGEWLVRRLNPKLAVKALPLVALVLLISPVLNLRGNLGDMIRITNRVRQGLEVLMEASDQAQWQSWAGLFRWVTVNTPGPGSPQSGPPAAFLGELGVSPQLLLYTGRPIVLNSQFENREIRDRYRQFLEALFATEENVLWEFARRSGAHYLFINRNFATATGPGTTSWLAGITGDLTLDMNVVRMHFRPDTLTRFLPVYDNEHYRVLRVLPEVRPAGPVPAWPSDHNSRWRLENFRVAEGQLVDLAGDRTRLAEFEAALSDLQDRQSEIATAVENRWRSGRGRGAQRPDLMLLHRQYVQTLLEGHLSSGGSQTGRLENAIRARLSEVDPVSGRPLSASLSALADGKGGWLDQLNTHAGEPMQYATCGQLLALAGRYDQAADQFAAAASFYPNPRAATGRWRPSEIQVRLWHEEVWWRLAAGGVDRAIELARLFAIHTPAQMREGEFFRRVGAIPGDFD
jgi:hypothetical protein